MKRLVNSDIRYEQHDTEILDRIPRENLWHSEMAEIERRFINGIIRSHHPRRLLEVGVSQGAGTLVLLNAIADMPESRLLSIDVLEHYYRNSSLPVGYLADGVPNKEQWSLIRGKDPSEVLGSDKGKFDFCIIDTAHVHPIVSLNFLSILPYLTDDAVVLIHDTSAYTKWPLGSFPHTLLASALLFRTVVADKLCPVDSDYLSHCNGFANLSALQITSDTRRYIGNVFSTLALPWGIYPAGQLEAIAACVRNHYDSNCIEAFLNAVELNLRLFCGDFREYVVGDLRKVLAPIADIERCDTFVYYGFGERARHLLKLSKKMKVRFPDEIWDIAKNGCRHDGIPVVGPKFETVSRGMNENMCVINTIQDYYVKVDVAYKFREKGFTNIVYAADFEKALLVRQYERISGGSPWHRS